MLKLPKERGFTLIEIVVVLAVISLLSSILSPQLIKYIDDAKIARATQETALLAVSFIAALKDLDKFPICVNGSAGKQCGSGNRYTLLFTGVSDGTDLPAGDLTVTDLPPGATPNGVTLPAAGTINGTSRTVKFHLEENNPDGIETHRYPELGRFRWRGSYVQDVTTLLDPWGKSYVVITEGMASDAVPGSGRQAWICSAGPDHKLATTIDGLSDVLKDDVCTKIIKR